MIVDSHSGSKQLQRRFEDSIEAMGLRNPALRAEADNIDLAYRRLRYALELTSPLSAAFGRHLSTRADLLPVTLCAELAAIPDIGPPTDSEVAREIFASQIGCAPERAFAFFEPEPLASRLFWQAHRARLGNHEVVVRIMHPEWRSFRNQTPSLTAFQGCLETLGMTGAGFEAALADFTVELGEATSFEAATRDAALLVSDAQVFEIMAPPEIHSHLCSSQVATVGLSQPLSGATAHTPETARTICLMWLRQALEGTVFPVDPRLENLGFAADHRILFTAGGFAPLPSLTREHLKGYLNAMVADDADEAAARLASATGRQIPDVLYAEFRRQLRQMAPFRDGFPSANLGDADTEGRRFSEELLIHWRIASQLGLTAGTALTPFYRGLLTMLRTAGQLAPGYDPLPDGLRDLRLLSAFGQIRDAMQPAEMGRLMENYFTAMLALPEQADRFLSVAGAQVPRVHGRAAPEAETGDGGNVRFSLLLAAAGLALILHRFAPDWGAASERAAAVALLLMGLFVLRAAVRWK